MALTTVTTPTRYRVVAQKVRGQASSFDLAGQVLDVDTTAAPGSRLPGPADLLTAAFAACVLKNVDRFSELLPFRYETAEIDVNSERQESPPKMKSITYRLRVTTDEPAARVDLLHRNIVRHGTVFNTLAATCEVKGEIIAVPVEAA